jgi:hypothetical protein
LDLYTFWVLYGGEAGEEILKQAIQNKQKVSKIFKTLPVQIEIEYTRLNGQKCVRVITAHRRVTSDRAKVLFVVHLTTAPQTTPPPHSSTDTLNKLHVFEQFFSRCRVREMQM